MASFADKVAALRTFLGVPPSMPMLQAVLTMNEMMGIVGEGPLPAQVQELVVTTGVVVTITPSTAAAAAPAAATAAAPAMPRSASSGKRKADDACGWVLLKEG
jgi:hypothetical protein